MMTPCPVCKGSKKALVGDSPCLCCKGQGEITKERDAHLAKLRKDITKRMIEAGIDIR